jgi:hypothetical protein
VAAGAGHHALAGGGGGPRRLVHEPAVHAPVRIASPDITLE